MSRIAKNIRHAARRGLARFRTSEQGSFSVEAVIWMPIFAVILTLIMNISMVFHGESQMIRVIQDANRAFSLGRLDDSDAVEAYILSRLSYLNAAMAVNTIIDGGYVMTQMTAPASDLMPFNFLTGAFNGIDIAISAQHIIEF